MTFKQLKVAVYADGADKDAMIAEYKKGYVTGFTTNPSLMKKAGVTDYVSFAKEVVAAIPDLPLSFEVFGDDFETMEKEAKVISALGKNVFVKIPIMLTDGTSTAPLIKKLSEQGIQLNVTAIFTLGQVRATVDAFKPGTKNIVSVFAGRLADSGIDPVPVMKKTAKICRSKPGTMSLWASTRELFNIVEADRCKCDIITVPNSVLAKIPGMGKTPMQGSKDTVLTFAKDIKDLGFSILK
ncbi:MAG TPA: transaldolase [Treponema sp.]|jgi:transaldolase|nr:transaldolase [Treponema sp.]HAK68359.1 transaldolase [Treponema sp.]HCA19048.1 transaldolase [Treponema sp.]